MNQRSPSRCTSRQPTCLGSLSPARLRKHAARRIDCAGGERLLRNTRSGKHGLCVTSQQDLLPRPPTSQRTLFHVDLTAPDTCCRALACGALRGTRAAMADFSHIQMVSAQHRGAGASAGGLAAANAALQKENKAQKKENKARNKENKAQKKENKGLSKELAAERAAHAEELAAMAQKLESAEAAAAAAGRGNEEAMDGFGSDFDGVYRARLLATCVGHMGGRMHSRPWRQPARRARHRGGTSRTTTAHHASTQHLPDGAAFLRPRLAAARASACPRVPPSPRPSPFR